jgi:hypothetical protein
MRNKNQFSIENTQEYNRSTKVIALPHLIGTKTSLWLTPKLEMQNEIGKWQRAQTL